MLSKIIRFILSKVDITLEKDGYLINIIIQYKKVTVLEKSIRIGN